MTIPSTERRAGPFNGAGVLVAHPFAFKVFADTDIAVTIADANDIETVGTLDSDYLVTLNADQDSSPGGTVTYAVAGVATALPIGYTLAINGARAYEQQANLPQGSNFTPASIEQALDVLEIQIQQLRDDLNRTAKITVLSPAATDTTLPIPSAHSIIGWNDDGTALQNYAPNSIDLSVSTLIADLIATANIAKGDAMIGVKRTATGAVGATVHDQFEAMGLNVKADFAAAGDDTADDLPEFQACYSACVASGAAMLLPAGTYRLNGSWTISHSNVRIIPLGKVTLHFVNAGQGVIFDGGTSSGNLYGVVFGGAIPIHVKGNAATTDAAFIRATHHSNINLDLKDATTACRVNFAVCTVLRVECSVNTGAFAKTPTTGIILDQRGAGEYVAACDIYPIIEGVSGTGIVATSASFNNIWGGTSEGNAKGITFSSSCYLNQVHGTDFEANSTSDIEDAGNNNSFNGTRAALKVILTGKGAVFRGGYATEVATTGSTLTSYLGMSFSDNVSVGITGSGTIASRVGCTRVNTSAVVTARYVDIVGDTGTWTPTLTQTGSVTLTVNSASYVITGGMAHLRAKCTITGAGTAGSEMIIGGIPAAAAPKADMVTHNMPLGQAVYIDASVGNYVGACVAVSSSTMNVRCHGVASTLGITPNFAAANTDTLVLDLCYPIA